MISAEPGPAAAPMSGTRGKIRVANDVVAWIAALAASGVPGVAGLYQPGARSRDHVLRPETAHRGVRVRVLDDLSLELSLYVALSSEASIPATAPLIQGEVAAVVNRMLGLKVRSVNIYVREVVFT